MTWSFDRADHIYQLDGATVPSVTGICNDSPVVYGDPANIERAGEWGQAIHHATLAFDLDAYHPDDYPPFVDPYIVVYRTFLGHHRCRWRLLEQARVHPSGFGGKVDRIGIVDGFDTVVDYKSGALADWHPLQTAGYDVLHDDRPPRVRRRAALYLGPTRYRWMPHTNRRDYNEFVQRARAQGVKL